MHAISRYLDIIFLPKIALAVSIPLEGTELMPGSKPLLLNDKYLYRI